MTTDRRPWTTLRIALIALAAVALLAAAITVMHIARTAAADGIRAQSFTVGGCVTLPASGVARAAVCSEDPSYTVGAVTAAGVSCPSAAYQRAEADDAHTLCLVPNLVAEHCYLLSMPIGTLARSTCAAETESGDGVLVQVTERLEVADGDACRTGGGDHAWPYPTPARTYCTRTLL